MIYTIKERGAEGQIVFAIKFLLLDYNQFAGQPFDLRAYLVGVVKMNSQIADFFLYHLENPSCG